MRDSCTHCTHTKPLHFGIPRTTPDAKLEFVEHVLGVLVESRYGTGNPYARLGDPAVMTGNSQMFANVRLLTAAEIEAHLELPLALANGRWLLGRTGFSPKVVWAKAREIVAAINRRLKPTAIQRNQNDVSSMPRGSPIFRGPVRRHIKPTVSAADAFCR